MPAHPDLIIWGAHIRTLDPAQPTCAAVAIKDGTIVATGDNDSIRAMRGPGTNMIDGHHLFLVPGITDSHIHPISSSLATRGMKIFDTSTVDELREQIRAERQRIGPDEWILGAGLHYEVFAESGIRGDLFDEATAGRPMVLRFFDGHTILVNQPVLDLAGITGPMQFSEEASVVCVDGKPTGELQESAAMDLANRVIPELGPSAEYALYKESFRRFSANGLTMLHAMDATPEEFAIYRKLEENGDLTCRVIVPLWQKPDTTRAEMRDQLPLRDERGHLWRAGAAKFFIDGVIETGTGWLTEPDTHGAGRNPFWADPDYYAEAVSLFAKAGFQCITHATGDRGVRAALDAYEAAMGGPEFGRCGPHRIEHDEIVDPQDVPRFAQLDVTASMQPLHMEAATPEETDAWAERAGHARTARAFPAQTLVQAGARLALGSDWMVAPFDPRIGMAWARLRRKPGHPELPPRAPEQALTALQTLEGYTTGAAATVAEQDISGRIKPGYRGDLTAFAADPVDTDADCLPDLPILLTVVDGRITHQAG